MRLVLVHGIAQENLSEIIVRENWLYALKQSLGLPQRFEQIEVVAPFYGNVLARHAGTKSLVTHVVKQGISADDEERKFIESGLDEIADAHGITDAQIDAMEQDPVVEQGVPHDRRLIKVAVAIERFSPLHGELALRFLKQAYVYLKDPRATADIDDIVAPVLSKGPCVLVAHSLGSVVTFKLLRKAPQEIPLYVTIGSPLTLRAVRKALGKPRTVPDGVKRWLNGVDVNDFVTLGQGLTEKTEYSNDIENLLDIKNGSDAHDATEYLQDQRIREAISGALP